MKLANLEMQRTITLPRFARSLPHSVVTRSVASTRSHGCAVRVLRLLSQPSSSDSRSSPVVAVRAVCRDFQRQASSAVTWNGCTCRPPSAPTKDVTTRSIERRASDPSIGSPPRIGSLESRTAYTHARRSSS